MVRHDSDNFSEITGGYTTIRSGEGKHSYTITSSSKELVYSIYNLFEEYREGDIRPPQTPPRRRGAWNPWFPGRSSPY